MNTSAFGVERGTLIRVPAVANLMIDSADRDTTLYPNPFSFQINKRQSYVTGFFSRIGATEVVLEWCYDNINQENNIFNLDVSGIALSSTLVPEGIYTVEQLLDALKASFEAQHPNYTLTIDSADGQVVLTPAGPDGPGPVVLPPSEIATLLDLSVINLNQSGTEQGLVVGCPDLRPFRYVDIVSENLTSVQDVRDATTQTQDRNVLVRWYFSFDDPPQLDGLGFPILMGYTRFCLRRIYNPPKQIKWEQNLPISNLGFAVYAPNGTIVPGNEDDNFLITLQLSEG
jgi:hypothetical protein